MRNIIIIILAMAMVIAAVSCDQATGKTLPPPVYPQQETVVFKGAVTGVTNGKWICNAYFGEFNGHTWYVFYDNLAVPSVVHDPLCKCNEKERL